MGYFSNGTEGIGYQEVYCFHCEHYPKHEDDPNCPVWQIHLLYNGEHCNEPSHPVQAMLNEFIPRHMDGHNDKCTMFMPCIKRDNLTQDMFKEEDSE